MKVGTLSLTPSQILANVKTAIPAIANTIKGGWENIQSFYVKTHSSVSLPIWACDLGEAEGGRWSVLTADASKNAEEQVKDDDDEESSAEEENQKIDEQIKGKGKKRVFDETSDKPAKKVKTKNPQDTNVADVTVQKKVPASKPPEETSKSNTKVVPPSPPIPAKVAKKTKIKPSETTDDKPSKRPPKTKASNGREPTLDPASKSPEETSKSNAKVVTPSPPALAKVAKKTKIKPSDLPTDDRPSKRPPKTKSSSLESPDPNSTSNTLEQHKAKRNDSTGERKKAKVVKGKLGRSAKVAIIGKRAAQA